MQLHSYRGRLGLATTATTLALAVIALACGAITPAPASAAPSCFATFFFTTGNYSDSACTKKVAVLTSEYVLAELVFKKVGRVWCALLGEFTGEYQAGTCTTLENNGLYTRVIGPAGKNEPLILPEPIEKTLVSSGKSGEIRLVTSTGMELKCKASTNTSEFTTPDEGAFSILFSECKGSLGGTCSGEGLSKGSVAFTGKLHYWQGVLGGKAVDTLTYLINEAKITCELSVKIVVKGCAAALAEPIEKATNVTKDVFTQEKGLATIKEVLAPETTKATKCVVETAFNGGKVEESALSGTEENEKFALGGKAVEITLMK
jgi:hypothetical protein